MYLTLALLYTVRKIFTYILLLLFIGINSNIIAIAQTSGNDKMFEIQHNQGTDVVKVKVFGAQPNLDKFILMNLIGRSVKEKTYTLGEEYVIFNDLAMLPSGLYVMLAKDKTGKLMSSVKFYL